MVSMAIIQLLIKSYIIQFVRINNFKAHMQKTKNSREESKSQ